jgi:hypothetical protein
MAQCASGVVHNLKHNKPLLHKIWLVNLGINIIQHETNTLGQTNFVFIHGGPLITPTMEFNKLCIFPGIAFNM